MSLFEQCDFHVHTSLSPCAREEMVCAAIAERGAELGIRYLGITDHIHPATHPHILRRVRSEVEALDTRLAVFVGCEADILDVGRHTLTDEMVSGLDFVAVSANHFHAGWVAQPRDASPAGVGRHFLDMFRYACSLEFADVVAHPMFVFPRTYDPTCLELLSDDDLMEAIALAKGNNVAMEISPRALARDQYFFRIRFYSLCKEAGVKFSIGSDAHRLESVGQVGVLAPLIAELGITDDDIWLPVRKQP